MTKKPRRTKAEAAAYQAQLRKEKQELILRARQVSAQPPKALGDWGYQQTHDWINVAWRLARAASASRPSPKRLRTMLATLDEIAARTPMTYQGHRNG
jgi:hypothetical protein